MSKFGRTLRAGALSLLLAAISIASAASGATYIGASSAAPAPSTAETRAPRPAPSTDRGLLAAALSGQSPFKEDAKRAAIALGLAPRAGEVQGPFTELEARVADALYESILPGARSGTLHWPLLALTFVIAAVFFVVRRGRGAKDADGRERPCRVIEYLLPRRIYTHPSARVDLWLYLIDRALMPVWVVLGLGAIAPAVEKATIRLLEATVGPATALQPSLGWKLLYSLCLLLVGDMIFYFTHLFGHRTRVGWAFHKVHHAAEVLTPVTRYREHFVEGIWYAAGGSAGGGLCGGVFGYLFGGGLSEVTVMSLGVFAFLYALNGNFRHYHVSFRYPRWLERWLQSPGMHHAHHSYLPHHWDTNLGLVTSVWDRLCGTLYIGPVDEETPWGLPAEEQARYRTLAQNLFGPFREVAALIGGSSFAHTELSARAGAARERAPRP
jgi:sterol desaturase/sphingolipid hydroxylase (fatty acid hydroxylase superfamily)